MNILRDSIDTHMRWAKAFREDARNAKTKDESVRHLLAAVHSAIAITEILSEYSIERKEITSLANAKIRHFDLLRELRIHTFHRRVTPDLAGPEPGTNSIFVGGRMSLSTGAVGSSASITFGQNGLEVFEKNGGTVKRRPGSATEISVMNGKLLDKNGNVWITLDEGIDNFLSDVPSFLSVAKCYLQPGLSLE